MLKRITYTDKLALIVILVGAGFRLYNYAGWSLSNDELSAMARLQYPSFSQMITEGVKLNDMHPPGVQAFLWQWTQWFGTNELMYRLPFVILGCLCTALVYLTGARWFSKQAGLIASSFYACLSFPVLYSQLARPYSPGMFFSLAFVYCWSVLFLRRNGEGKAGLSWWILYILSGAACMYTHYFCFLFAGLFALSAFFIVPVDLRKKNIIAGILMVVLFLPALPVFIYQFSIGGLGGPEGWLGAPAGNAVPAYLFYSLNESWLVVATVLIILIAGINWGAKNDDRNKLRLLALVIFIVPALIAYFYSVFRNPVFQYSILVFGFPFFLILISSWINALSNRLITVLMILVIASSGFSTIAEKHFYSTSHFAVFKEIAAATFDYNRQFGYSKVTNTMNVISPFYIHYYLDRLDSSLRLQQVQCSKISQYVELAKIVDSTSTPYFLHGWSNNYHAPETEMIIAEKYPYLVTRNYLYNAGILVFAKESMNKYKPIGFNYSDLADYDNNYWPDDTLHLLPAINRNGLQAQVYEINPSGEYCSGNKLPANKSAVHKGANVVVDCWFKADSLTDDVLLVFSVDHEGKSVCWRSQNLRDYLTKGKAWNHAWLGYQLSEETDPSDKVSWYIWNPHKQHLLLDDFRIRVW